MMFARGNIAMDLNECQMNVAQFQMLQRFLNIEDFKKHRNQKILRNFKYFQKKEE